MFLRQSYKVWNHDRIYTHSAAGPRGPARAPGIRDGFLHRDRVGHQRRRQALRDLQQARLAPEPQPGCDHDRQRLDARIARGCQRRVVQALDDGKERCARTLRRLLRRRAARVELEARLRRRSRSAGRRRSTGSRRWRAAARAGVPARARPTRRDFGELRRGRAGLVARSLDRVSSVARPRFRPASSAPSTFTSNQLSMERETNW